MQSVMEVVADGELTVVLSSHIIADLERVCDHIVILAQGTTQLAGSSTRSLRATGSSPARAPSPRRLRGCTT